MVTDIYPTIKPANSIKTFLWVSGLLICLIASAVDAEESYQVTHVYDGDTVQLTRGAEKIKLRLQAIDAPERNQPYGQKARRALRQLCMPQNTKVDVQISGEDQYQRSLGNLKCNDTDASLHLLQNGYAWAYQKYNPSPAFIKAAEEARAGKLGLWQQENPTPPWVWRRIHSNIAPLQ